MGEYAKYAGERVKIGTCEDMYYLRADQAQVVQAESGNVDPVRQADLIRFRFPFPQEDGTNPGAFDDHNWGLGVSGVKVPDGVEHNNIQFSASGKGLLCSLPCPESADKLPGVSIHKNGYSGEVKIVQQRVWEGRLVLVCECGSCGSKYRLETLADAQPIVDALTETADYNDHENRIANMRPDAVKCTSRGDYYREVSRRIVAGYENPPAWIVERFGNKVTA